jgi:hypothetical protein
VAATQTAKMLSLGFPCAVVCHLIRWCGEIPITSHVNKRIWGNRSSLYVLKCMTFHTFILSSVTLLSSNLYLEPASPKLASSSHSRASPHTPAPTSSNNPSTPSPPRHPSLVQLRDLVVQECLIEDAVLALYGLDFG